jgi:hypothetical protein
MYIKEAKNIMIKWAHEKVMDGQVAIEKLPFMWDGKVDVNPDDRTVTRVMLSIPGCKPEEGKLHQPLLTDIQPLNDGYRWRAVTDNNNFKAAVNWLMNFFPDTYKASMEYEDFKKETKDLRFCQPFQADTKYDTKHERTYSGKGGLHYTTIGQEHLKAIRTPRTAPKLQIVGGGEAITTEEKSWITVIKKKQQENNPITLHQAITKPKQTTQGNKFSSHSNPNNPRNPRMTRKRMRKTNEVIKKVSFNENMSVNTEVTEASTQAVQLLEERMEEMTIEYEERFEAMEQKYIEMFEHNLKVERAVKQAEENSKVATTNANEAKATAEKNAFEPPTIRRKDQILGKYSIPEPRKDE